MLLNDLSKAFDCIVQDFLIAKLETYDLSYEALKVMQNDLTGRKHRTEVNDSLRPLFIQHYIYNVFFFVEEGNAASCAGDTTP